MLRFKNPQRLRGLVGRDTTLADLPLPVRLGGDHAMSQLFARWMVLRDADAPGTVDHSFVSTHTAAFAELSAHRRSLDEDAVVQETGLSREELDAAFSMIVTAKRMIVCWAMGITQHLVAIRIVPS